MVVQYGSGCGGREPERWQPTPWWLLKVVVVVEYEKWRRGRMTRLEENETTTASGLH